MPNQEKEGETVLPVASEIQMPVVPTAEEEEKGEPTSQRRELLEGEQAEATENKKARVFQLVERFEKVTKEDFSRPAVTTRSQHRKQRRMPRTMQQEALMLPMPSEIPSAMDGPNAVGVLVPGEESSSELSDKENAEVQLPATIPFRETTPEIESDGPRMLRAQGFGGAVCHS